MPITTHNLESIFGAVKGFEYNIADDKDESELALLEFASQMQTQFPGYWRKGWLATRPGQRSAYELLVLRAMIMKFESDDIDPEMPFPSNYTPNEQGRFSPTMRLRLAWRDFYKEQLKTAIVDSARQSKGRR